MLRGIQGVKAYPQNFLYVENPGKIPEAPGKILENLVKIPANLCTTLKIRANMGPNVCRKTQKHRKCFLDIMRKKGLPVVQKLFGHVWRNSGKNTSHPQKVF